MRTLQRALPALADGGTVVCLATGPSLTAADVGFCRSKAVVIAVNDAHRLAPWADVLYSSDRFWWMHHRGVPGFAGLKATIEHAPGRYAEDVLQLVPTMHVLRNTGNTGVETATDGLRTCGLNSGGAAVNLAVHLGARRIVLLGYDMQLAGKRRHFFGDHPRGLSNSHHFPLWRKGFATMVEPLRALGITVVNATRSTALSAFPRVALEDALAPVRAEVA